MIFIRLKFIQKKSEKIIVPGVLPFALPADKAKIFTRKGGQWNKG